MNRRAFLGWLAAGVTAVVAAPAMSRLDLLAAPVEVLAIDPTVPLWVLELQAYERHIELWSRIPIGGGILRRRQGTPKLPVYPCS